MNKQDEQQAIRRILVALDASLDSLAALEAAAELAASLEAELHGLFVEDSRLLRLSGLPVAREVRYPFVAPAKLDRTRMERALRAQAAQARQALAAASERRHVAWSFQVVRGEVAPEVLAAALEADLLTLGRASRPLIRKVRTGSTARAAAENAPCCVLVLQRDAGIHPPVLVTYDGSPTAQKALMIAARLARPQAGSLTVLVISETEARAQRLQTEATDSPYGQVVKVRYRWLTDATCATLIQETQNEKSGVLVLSSTVIPQEALQTLLDTVDCPVLLVR